MAMRWNTENLLILHDQLVLSVTPGPTQFTTCKKSSFKFIVACSYCLMQMEILKGREKSVAVTKEMHPTFCSVKFYNTIFTKSSK